MHIRNTKKKIVVLSGIGIATTAALVSMAFFIRNEFQEGIGRPSARPDAQEIRRLAQNTVSSCAKESYRPGCYDREIPKLMDVISMEDAFRVTKIIQDTDRAYNFCHVLGHELSAREVKKKPDSWKTVIARCPSGMCSNGCIHGGMQERFRAESLTDTQTAALVPELQTLCEEKSNWHPTGLERGTCYHAVGHLAMYMTGGDIKKSVVLCDEIVAKGPGRDFMHVCLDGAFMQIFQPLEPEDFALVRGRQPTKETIAAFCNAFTGEAKGSCISESWPLFAEQVKKSEGLTVFCNKEEPAEQDRCYQGMFYVLAIQFQFDASAMQRFCSKLPVMRRGQCSAGMASRLIETDYGNISKAVQFCDDASRYDPAEQCFQQMAASAGFHFHAGSKEFLELCSKLPDRWKQVCAR
ncbi:MAG: hypothetical protein HY617_02165 [Candidatus Sungbacteria bacterium]|nr:hypothetical protein [Candidatus Sungbacteria bacterium]